MAATRWDSPVSRHCWNSGDCSPLAATSGEHSGLGRGLVFSALASSSPLNCTSLVLNRRYVCCHLGTALSVVILLSAVTVRPLLVLRGPPGPLLRLTALPLAV